MYPQEELKELAGARELLHRRITAHRVHCVEAAAGVAAPLALLDRGLAVWRQLSPLIKIAALPLALIFQRKWASRPSLIGTLFRWAPAVLASLSGNK